MTYKRVAAVTGAVITLLLIGTLAVYALIQVLIRLLD